MNFKYHLPLLFLLTVFISNVSYSQSNRRTERVNVINYGNTINKPLTQQELAMINEAYGDKAQSNILSKPQRVKDIKHILRNRIEIKSIPNKRDQKPCTLLSEVPLMDYYVSDLERESNFNPQNFNPLKYLFEFYSTGTHMYQVDNTNYFIIIKSQLNN
ncbi:hypothetical protein [uncultured Psychroserpens sp.]|uniref:hypothetical protein n=1 Tax=uncultured Psychroserpens sp. TaxID=255436 RepID=UPI0026076148|nr:hypothetical protein [uncultured Psychroserpens sp.]